MKKLILLLAAFAFCSFVLPAESFTVSGVIKDSCGLPLAGADVVEIGTMNYATADAKGYYEIKVSGSSAELKFTFVGMLEQKVAVDGRKTIDVTLEDDALCLQESIAIGYGFIKKEEITTSIVRVKSDDFTSGGVSSPLQLIQGKVAGLGIANTSGDPSASPSITLRGISTLAASSSPLIVIDGIVGGSINSISPEDIESIDVLKDGSAAAIYGTRGTNGVIIITTKRPVQGHAVVAYEGYVKVDNMCADEDRLSSDEWRAKMNDESLPALVRATMQDYGGSTDWVKAITRTPVSNNHYFSVSGGSAKTNYFASITYSDKQGIYETSFNRSLAIRASINHSMFDNRLRINFNINDKVGKNGICPEELYNSASQRNPTYPMYADDGSYYQTSSQSPLCALKEWSGVNKGNRLMANGKISVEPISGLVLSVTGSYQNEYNEREWAGSHKTYSAIYGAERGYADLSGGHGDDRLLETQADYSKSFGDHNLSATVGYSYNKYVNQTWGMTAYNFPIDGFGVWNMESAESTLDGKSKLKSYKWERKLIGFYGRLNYSYANRYLLMASIRREGSDKFGENHRWGWFPSISLGWRISNENFMKSAEWVNDLKFRVGYGVTGTEPESSYQYISLYNLNSSYMSMVDGKWISSIIPVNNPNPNLKWEEKHEANVGLDFSLFGNRLRGTIDGYYRYTKDLLYTYSVPTPPNVTNSMLANVGSISNKGVEISIEGDAVKSRDLLLTIGGNMSYNDNRVEKLSNDTYSLEYLKLGNLTHVQTYSHRLEAGWPIGNFYGWQQVGLKSNGTAWRIVGAENSTAGEAQKTVIGNGIPKFFVGMHINMDWKGLDVSIAFRGAFKYQILNQYRMMYETLAWLQTYNVPRGAYEKVGDYYNCAPSTYCDYYVENGDYLKLDNVTIGYTFEFNKRFIQKLRLYLAGQNLYTFTNYTGMDPEAVNITGLTPGIDNLNKYPTLRSFTFGLNITF